MIKCGSILDMTLLDRTPKYLLWQIFWLTPSPFLDLSLCRLPSSLSLPLQPVLSFTLHSFWLCVSLFLLSASLRLFVPPSSLSLSPLTHPLLFLCPLSLSCLCFCLCLSTWLAKCEEGLLPQTCMFFPVLLGGLIKDTFFLLTHSVWLNAV